MLCGHVFQAMWLKTLTAYPHLSEIDDWNFILQVLESSTEDQQNDVLERFREHKLAKEKEQGCTGAK